MSTQPQVTHELLMRQLKRLGIDTTVDQSGNPIVMKSYTDLAEILADYKAKKTTAATKARFDEFRLRLKERDSLRKAFVDLREADVRDTNKVLEVAANAVNKLSTEQVKIQNAKDYGVSTVFSNLRNKVDPAGFAGTKGQERQLVSALIGTLEDPALADKVRNTSLPSLYNRIESEFGVDLTSEEFLNSVGSGNQRGRLEDLNALMLENRQSQIYTLNKLERDIDVARKSRDSLLKLKPSQVDEAFAELKKIEGAVNSATKTLDASSIGLNKDDLEAFDIQVAEEDAFEQLLMGRLQKLDDQLNKGEGIGRKEQIRRNVAQAIGRDNFVDWALDNGYTKDDLGRVDFDSEGKPIMSTYQAGRKGLQAVKHYEYQLKHPNRQSRFFGRGPATNEMHIFDVTISEGSAERLKHSDGKWRFIETEIGPRFIKDSEAKNYLMSYQNSSVTIGMGRDENGVEKGYLESNGRYFEIDPNTGNPIDGLTYVEVEKPAGGFSGEPAVIEDSDGDAERFMKIDDILESRSFAGIRDATDTDIDSFKTKYADLGIAETDQPPADGFERVTAMRRKTHALGVADGRKLGRNFVSYVNMDTGEVFRIDPEKVQNLQVHETRSDTNLKDLRNFIRSQRMGRIKKRMDVDPTGEIRDIPGTTGLKGEYFETNKTNFVDGLERLLSGPDMKRTRAESAASEAALALGERVDDATADIDPTDDPEDITEAVEDRDELIALAEQKVLDEKEAARNLFATPAESDIVVEPLSDQDQKLIAEVNQRLSDPLPLRQLTRMRDTVQRQLESGSITSEVAEILTTNIQKSIDETTKKTKEAKEAQETDRARRLAQAQELAEPPASPAAPPTEAVEAPAPAKPPPPPGGESQEVIEQKGVKARRARKIEEAQRAAKGALAQMQVAYDQEQEALARQADAAAEDKKRDPEETAANVKRDNPELYKAAQQAVASTKAEEREKERAEMIANIQSKEMLGAPPQTDMIRAAMAGQTPPPASPPPTDDDEEDDGGASLKKSAVKNARQKELEKLSAAQQGRESENSLKRDITAQGGPGMASPTDTDPMVGSGVIAPSADDKLMAEAKSLVRNNLEIRDMLMGNPPSRSK